MRNKPWEGIIMQNRTELSREEWETIINTGTHLEPKRQQLLNSAFEEEWKRREAMRDELSFLTQKVRGVLGQSENAESTQAKILKRLKEEKVAIEELNHQLKTPEASQQATYALKTNKMAEIIEGTSYFIKNYFFKLMEDHVEGYVFQTQKEEITMLGKEQAKRIYGKDFVYGNSNATFLSNALINTYLQTESIDTLGIVPAFKELNREGNTWVAQSAFLYAAPIPPAINLSNKSSYVHSNELTITHSGYAFGGQRKLKPKYFGPEDCSSWIGKVTYTNPDSISTEAMLHAYRQGLNEDAHLIPGSWTHEPIAKTLEQHCQPVKISDPQKDIKPGQVWFNRLFKPIESKAKGFAGHTGLVVGTQPSGDAVVLSYSRNMPDVEGFGIKVFSAKDTMAEQHEEKVGFFELKF